MNAATYLTSGRRYTVRRTLAYAPTHYGATDDYSLAVEWAQSRTALGYPSEVIDNTTGEVVWRRA